jgi:hypothetical protein
METKLFLKEKKRIRAEIKAKVKMKLAKGKEYAQLLKEKIISFGEFKELMNELNKS